MNKIILFVFVISIINIFVFFVITDSSSYVLNFKDAIEQPWRFVTFQFFHTNIAHLIENVIGFILIAFIAIEFDTDFKKILPAYFLSIFIVIIPLMTLFPTVNVAGNSTGIYGILALSLLKGRKLISEKITIPLVSIFIFSASIFNLVSSGIILGESLKNELFHFLGFISGGTINFIPTQKAKKLLRI